MTNAHDAICEADLYDRVDYDDLRGDYCLDCGFDLATCICEDDEDTVNEE